MNKGLRETPKSRIPSQEYLDNWDKIFSNKRPNGKEEKQNG